MRIMRTLTAVMFALFMVPAMAASPVNRLIEMHSDPQEFYLFDQTDSEVVSFDSEQTVRICAGSGRHVTALEVNHDGRSATLKPGNCRRFTARSFTLVPAGQIGDNWSLTGTIERG